MNCLFGGTKMLIYDYEKKIRLYDSTDLAKRNQILLDYKERQVKIAYIVRFRINYVIKIWQDLLLLKGF